MKEMTAGERAHDEIELKTFYRTSNHKINAWLIYDLRGTTDARRNEEIINEKREKRQDSNVIYRKVKQTNNRQG